MATPLVLSSSETVTTTPTLDSPSLIVVPLHVVSASVPTPTLTNGRPV